MQGLIGEGFEKFEQDLKSSLLHWRPYQQKEIEIFFTLLGKVSAYKRKLTRFGKLYDTNSSSYSPLLLQLLRSLANPKTDFSDLTYVAAGDPHISKYLNSLLNTPAKMHPLNQSSKVLIVFNGSWSGNELSAASKLVEEIGLSGKVSIVEIK